MLRTGGFLSSFPGACRSCLHGCSTAMRDLCRLYCGFSLRTAVLFVALFEASLGLIDVLRAARHPADNQSSWTTDASRNPATPSFLFHVTNVSAALNLASATLLTLGILTMTPDMMLPWLLLSFTRMTSEYLAVVASTLKTGRTSKGHAGVTFALGMASLFAYLYMWLCVLTFYNASRHCPPAPCGRRLAEERSSFPFFYFDARNQGNERLEDEIKV